MTKSGDVDCELTECLSAHFSSVVYTFLTPHSLVFGLFSLLDGKYISNFKSHLFF